MGYIWWKWVRKIGNYRERNSGDLMEVIGVFE